MAGIVSKNRMAPDGRAYGGKPFARGALFGQVAILDSIDEVNKTVEVELENEN